MPCGLYSQACVRRNKLGLEQHWQRVLQRDYGFQYHSLCSTPQGQSQAQAAMSLCLALGLAMPEDRLWPRYQAYVATWAGAESTDAIIPSAVLGWVHEALRTTAGELVSEFRARSKVDGAGLLDAAPGLSPRKVTCLRAPSPISNHSAQLPDSQAPPLSPARDQQGFWTQPQTDSDLKREGTPPQCKHQYNTRHTCAQHTSGPQTCTHKQQDAGCAAKEGAFTRSHKRSADEAAEHPTSPTSQESHQTPVNTQQHGCVEASNESAGEQQEGNASSTKRRRLYSPELIGQRDFAWLLRFHEWRDGAQ